MTALICKICSASCSTPRSLAAHVRRMHKLYFVEYQVEYEGRPKPDCPICGKPTKIYSAREFTKTCGQESCIKAFQCLHEHSAESKEKMRQSRIRVMAEKGNIPWEKRHTKRDGGHSYLEQWMTTKIDALGLAEKYDIVLEYPVAAYSADFAFVNAKVVVEMDGKQHQEDPTHVASDLKRDRVFTEMGWTVFRISKRDLTEVTLAQLIELLESTNKQPKVLHAKQYFTKELTLQEKFQLEGFDTSQFDLEHETAWVFLVALKAYKKHHPEIIQNFKKSIENCKTYAEFKELTKLLRQRASKATTLRKDIEAISSKTVRTEFLEKTEALYSERKVFLDTLDFTLRGAITKVATAWKVSGTQARRILKADFPEKLAETYQRLNVSELAEGDSHALEHLRRKFETACRHINFQKATAIDEINERVGLKSIRRTRFFLYRFYPEKLKEFDQLFTEPSLHFLRKYARVVPGSRTIVTAIEDLKPCKYCGRLNNWKVEFCSRECSTSFTRSKF